ncbi:TRAP transporter large permease [Ammoniphilus resinae]|uniref:Tripartite ATP-independent transporter DctM subunit n=1 Tax=Ammoniphilus resinae TaxID=861532 RepID=A0ABS4GMB6_9BACL|nr:TRAP transporter large permease [Ammoniphilus resinae]MBP1931394.1 tripartite ATP-independent transporter DctM subunit [Ammoniphilus resinae]
MLLVFLLFGLTLVMGIPIVFVLASTGITLFLLGDNDLIIFPQRLIAGTNSFPLMAIPLFILAGELMNIGGITNRIFDFAKALVGHIRGGLGHANVVASMVFAGMSGAAVADTAGLGTVEIKAMKDQKYDPEFAAAVTVASSTIGPIIPPSINFILYGSLASVSTGALFLGGIIPGILMGLSMMILVYVLAVRRNYPREERASSQLLWITFKRAFFPLLTPAIILGGIFLGIATPTEASVMAVLYALILGTVVYKQIKWKDFYEIFLRTSIITGSILLIIGVASPFGFMLAKMQIPQLMAQAFFGLTDNPLIIWIMLLALLLLLGCFMDATAIMIVLVPILLPTLNAFQIDLVQFGVVMSLALAIGLITPPVGLCLFLGSQIAEVPLDRVIRATIPFFIPLVGVLILITFIPQIVTFIPRLFLS